MQKSTSIKRPGNPFYIRATPFFLAGFFLALLGEFFVKVILQRNLGDFLSPVLFGNYLLIFLIVYTIAIVLKNFMQKYYLLWYYPLALGVGISIEWFGLHNTPLITPLIGKIGMFFFWTTIFVGPLLVAETDERFRSLKRALWLTGGVAAGVLALVAILFFSSPYLYSGLVWVFFVAFYGVLAALCFSYYKTFFGSKKIWYYFVLIAVLYLAVNMFYLAYAP